MVLGDLELVMALQRGCITYLIDRDLKVEG